MSRIRLYCQSCGRRYPFQGSAEAWQLFCAACTGPLSDSPSSETQQPDWVQRLTRRPRDPFQRRVIGGARLTKLLTVSPTKRVYRAAHTQLRGNVRAELFEAQFVERNEGYVRRVLEGAAVTRDMRSLHVTTVTDLGRRQDCAFILCDLHPSSLRALLERGETLDINRALELAEGVLQGLAAVEAVGAVHGNVSPDGILLSHDGSSRLDHLGTALRPEDMERLTLTTAGAVRGPALYAAPEKLRGDAVPDIRADLYSLGVTMYEMLSGRPPHEGPNGRQVILKHLNEPAPDLRLHLGDAPPELCDFVSQLMAKDPADRPQTAQQALEDLRQCAVVLSRGGRIRPVRAAVTPAEHRRSSLRWAIIWCLVAVTLALLAIIPVLLIYKQRQSTRAQLAEAEAGAAHTVLTILQESDPLLKDDLSSEEALAISTLLEYRLSFYPELTAVRMPGASAPRPGGRTTPDALGKAGIRNTLVAMHAPGFHRRNWTLVFTSRGKPPWAVRAECAVDATERSTLDVLERAADEVLSQAASRLKLSPLGESRQATGAGMAAWALMGSALRAEQENRWDEALACSRQATQEARGVPPFAVLRAFYETVEGTHRTGRVTPPLLGHGSEDGAAPAKAGTIALPPELAGLAAVLQSMRQGATADIQRHFGQYLARCPRSARGYFLLGLWRLYGLGQADEAAIAFRHAALLDPLYTPAARRYVELLALQRPTDARAFLDQLHERAHESEAARRIEELAREFVPQTGGTQ